MAYTKNTVTEAGDEVAVATTVLWLPGFGSAHRRSARAVSSLIRRAGNMSRTIDELRRAGHADEAALLGDERRVERARQWIAESRVLTWDHPAYPTRWRRWSFAPPVLWSSGTPAVADWVAGVGSRRVEASVLAECRRLGTECAVLGRGLVSGAADGCDRAFLAGAADAGAPTLAILPRGIEGNDHCRLDWILSARPPGEPFSTSAAMERNALIYAAADVAMVGHARFRQGGTWHGALDALRRRLCRIAVLDLPSEPGLAALASLGGSVLHSADDLKSLLDEPSATLF